MVQAKRKYRSNMRITMMTSMENLLLLGAEIDNYQIRPYLFC